MMTILELYIKLKQSVIGRNLLLNTENTGINDLTHLLHSNLGVKEISIKEVNLELQHVEIIINGTTEIFEHLKTSLELRFLKLGNDIVYYFVFKPIYPDFGLEYIFPSLPTYFNVGQDESIRGYQLSFLYDFRPKDTVLVLSSYHQDISDARIKKGLNISFNMELQGTVLSLFQKLTNTNDLTFKGHIDYMAEIPSVILRAPLGTSFKVGEKGLEDIYLTAYSRLYEEGYLNSSRIGFQAELALGANDKKLIFSSQLPIGHSDELVIGAKSGDSPVFLKDVLSFMGLTSFDDFLPDKFPQLGLETFESQISTLDKSIIELHLGLRAESWKIFDGISDVLSIKNIYVKVTAQRPFKDNIDVELGGVITILGGSIHLYGTYPGFILKGQLNDGEPIKLNELVEELAGNNIKQFIPELEISSLNFYAAPTEKKYDFEIEVNGNWELFTIRDTKFSIAQLGMGFYYQGSNALISKFGGRIYGIAKIGRAELYASVEINTGTEESVFHFINSASEDDSEGKTLSLKSLIVIFIGVDLPDEIPDITFKEIKITSGLDTKTFKLYGKVVVDWDFFGLGKNTNTEFILDLSVVDGNFEYGIIGLKSESTLELVPGFEINGFDLNFTIGEKPNLKTLKWALDGNLKMKLQETPVEFKARMNQSSIEFKVESSDVELININDDFKLIFREFYFKVSGESLLATKTSLIFGAKGETVLNIEGTPIFNLKGSVEAIFTYESQLQEGETGFSFTFTPDTLPEGSNKITLKLPIPGFKKSNLETTIGEFKVKLGTEWGISIAIKPEFVYENEFGTTPKPTIGMGTAILYASIKGKKFDGGIKGIPKTANFDQIKENIKALVPIGFEIPNLLPKLPEGLYPDLGISFIGLNELSLSIDSAVKITCDLAFGLPSKLNNFLPPLVSNEVLGGSKPKLFKTYHPIDPEKRHFFSVAIIGSTEEIKGTLKNFPVNFEFFTEAIKVDKDGNATIDFDKLVPGNGKYGKLKILKPEFAFNVDKKTFKAKGGYSIRSEYLMIPLTLPFTTIVKQLIKGLKDHDEYKEIHEHITKILDLLPRGIPIRSINFIDDEENLSIDDLEAYCKEIVSAFFVPEVLKTVVNQFGGHVVNRLPKRFKDYLNIKIPQSMEFEFEMTPDGGISFGIEVKKPKGENKDNFSDHLQLLIPQPNGMINGVRLKKIAFGTAFSGMAIRLDLSTEVDVFDLLTLGSCLLLPEKKYNYNDDTLNRILPDRNKFARTFIVEDLLMFVIIKTKIPIPIPVFYKKIYLGYFGLEGLETELQLAFPRPEANIGEMLGKISELYKFFTSTVDWLDVGEYPLIPKEEGSNELDEESSLVKFKFGPVYAQLPGYLGYEEVVVSKELKGNKGKPVKKNIVIGTKKEWTFDFVDLVGVVGNTFKGLLIKKKVKLKNGEEKKAINYFVEYLRLEDRLNIKTIHLFNIEKFKIDIASAFTTPEEFEDIAYPLLVQKYKEHAGNNNPDYLSPSNELLDLLVKDNNSVEFADEDQGVVTFLRGGLNIADQIIFEAASGTLVSERKGFRTGITLKAYIANFMLSESLFFVKMNPNEKQFFRLLGRTSLIILDRDILKGKIEITPEKMTINGMIDAFPSAWPIQLKGNINGELTHEKYELKADASLLVGAFRAATQIDIDINKESQSIYAKIMFSTTLLEFRFNRRLSGGAQYERIETSFEANAFNLMKFDGELLLKRAHSDIDVMGRVSLKIGTFAHVGFEIKGAIDPQEGVLFFEAGLRPHSFLFNKDCRINGGAAAYLWIKQNQNNISAGDFVFTVGGYHPRFIKPKHYPSPAPLGINWQIDNKTFIKGSAYFAMNPASISAGGRLELKFDDWWGSAWFIAYADFISNWQPFYISTKLGVNVGAELKVFPHIKVSTTAKFELWGPDFGGKITFKVWVIYVEIPIGKPKLPTPPALNWTTFRRDLLPDQIINIIPDDGIESNQGESWMVRPDEFGFSLNTGIPIGKLKFNGKQIGEAKNIDIRPMQKAKVSSEFEVTIKKIDPDIQSARSRKVKAVVFNPKIVHSNVPSAIWGKPGTIDINQGLVNSISELKIEPVAPIQDGQSLDVPSENLSYSNLKSRELAKNPKVDLELKRPSDIIELNKIIDEALIHRENLIAALDTLDLKFDENFKLKNEKIQHKFTNELKHLPFLRDVELSTPNR